jgi:ADP-heptose:LPS heptosyltransferase
MSSESGRRYSPVNAWLKRIERGSKRALLAGLTRLAARSDTAQPDWASRPQRVLFLRHDRIGDMVVSTAVLHAIARAHPTIALDVLASPLNAPVLASDATIHRVVRFDRHRLRDYPQLWRTLRAAQYDVVVDPMVFNQSLTTLLLVLATRAPHRVGVVKPGKPNVYTMFATPPGDGGDHMLDHLAQLAIPFGVAPRDAKRMHVAVSDEERVNARAQWADGRRLLVNISAGEQFRRWADDRFVAVATHLRASTPDARVLILHSGADRERATAIAEAAGVVRADTPTLRSAIALVAEAEFVFSPDTSIVHLAGAFDVPTVAIFTADKVTRWRPRATHARAVVGHGETIDSVALADALAAITDVLAAKRHDAR